MLIFFIASEVGTSLDKLARAVFLTEVRLDNWMLTDRKKRLAETLAEE